MSTSRAKRDAVVNEHWTRCEFREDTVDFQPYTNFRFLFFAFAGLGVLVGLIGLIAEQRWQFAVTIPICAVVAWVSLTVQPRLHEAYRVEPEGLFFERNLLGWQSTRQLAALDSVHRVFVDSKPHFMSNAERRGRTPPYRWSYGLAIVLKRGKVIRLTEADESDFETAVDVARRFAERYGLLIDEPSPQAYIRVAGRHPPQVTYEDWKPNPL